MPKLEEYEDRPAYYVRANTSDAGEVTYDLLEPGRSVVWTYGLRDGDSIPWAVVRALDVLGVIDPGGETTLGPGELAPNIDSGSETLSDDEALEFIKIVQTQLGPTRADLVELRKILGLSGKKAELAVIGVAIDEYIENRSAANAFPTPLDIESSDHPTTQSNTSIEWSDDDGHERAKFQINLTTESPNHTLYTIHCIHISMRDGIEKWHASIDADPSWGRKIYVIKQKAAIIPTLVSKLEAATIPLGDPSEQLDPTVGNWFD
ncbi:hypothetical protein DVK02_01005 [Halobellus sp. Atlit-31R]|nr:hypothetical protein DVK02_01005 [Halobellus sp. Atlit-31R]